MGASFAALLLLPLAEANTLQFTVPIFATIMGALILSEPTGWHRWGAVLISFAGVLIVTQPGNGSFPPLGAAIGLTAACLTAVSAILLRQIGKTESASTTVFWFSLMSVPPLGLLYVFNLRAHDLTTWILLGGIGVVGAVAQLAGTASVRFAPVSAVIPMDYSSLIWSVSYGWLLFGTFPPATTWIGAAVITASALYIAHREHRLRLRRTNPSVGRS